MDEPDFLAPPPAGPPPLLSDQQLIILARQGWLCVDLPDSLSRSLQDVFESSLEFFNDPSQPKAELYPKKLGTEFGYYPVANEKEYLTFRCHVHGGSNASSASSASEALAVASAVALEAKVAQAWREAALYLFRILCDISRASDLDLSVWNDILDGTLTMPNSEQDMTHTLMRLFRYFPTTGFAGQHSDLGLLTLCVGNGEGLQALDRFQSTTDIPAWVNAPVGSGKGMVLIGETLKALSSNTVNTGAHRVVGNPHGRSSVVFALRHSTRHDIDFGLFGGEGVMSPKELWKSVQVGKININSTKEIREKQRAKLYADRSKSEVSDTLTTGQG
ncbi:hypothetical protein PV08_00864 [Exophiala spinifera]|uniref:Fe2OG dioxygenase domain-containing protein n=1 Tax=Exophiala spinifera TaxID=91928 RepID=A0A0D2C9M8_9EURO|nr:uncharacterized protein PV08_00864 [Exophiala spinifera]KIW20289.1 hypothetical protein PV08_00864 [Exophiala spinifera]